MKPTRKIHDKEHVEIIRGIITNELLMEILIDVLFSDDIDGDNCKKSNDHEIH